MYCRNCGNQVLEGSSFCVACGGDANRYSTMPDLNVHIRRREAKKKRLKIFAIVSVLFILAAGAGIGAFFGLSNMEETAEFIGSTKGTGLTEEEAEQILIGDISDEDWEIFDSSNEALAEVAGQYADEEGYIAEADEEAVINAVAGMVDEFYEKGIVSWYMCDEEGVYFEYSSGISAFYVLEREGVAAGSGEIEILSFSPFENEKNDEGNSREWDQAIDSGESIASVLKNAGLSSYKNEDVTVSLLKSIPESGVFLWSGHGNYYKYKKNSYPVLQTGQSATNRTGINDDNLSLTDVTATISTFQSTSNWCITPSFVEKYFSLNAGLVFLATCQSGRDDKMADAFISVGADAVFVNVGENNVRIYYTEVMMYLVIEYMLGAEDGVYLTADEALVRAQEIFAEYFIEKDGVEVTGDKGFLFFTWEVSERFDTLEEYIEGAKGGTHTEVRGEGDYTLVSHIRGTISFDDEITDSELSEIMRTLSVTLYTENGDFVKSTTLLETEFNINDLDSGTYKLQLYSNNEAVGLPEMVTVEEHRYSSVNLLYSLYVPLEGYVFDEETEAPLQGVAISADMTTGQFSAETVTDENGYYCIEVFGVNTYSLSYEIDGYNPVQNEVEITLEMYNQAQDGGSTMIDDIYMESTSGNNDHDDVLVFNGHRYKLYYSENITWTDAKEYCEELGGHLVTINSEEEQIAVYQYIESFEIDADIWIGITDAESEGDWSHWITGEEVTYTNWGDGEPDNNAGSFRDQNYGVICSGYRSGSTYYIEPGEWDDIDVDDSTTSGYFLCEWEQDIDPDDEAGFSGHRYEVFEDESITSWEDAQAYCESLGGYLAIITSQEENDYLYQFMLDSGFKSAYFGLTDSEEEGVWLWVDGSVAEYTNWHSGEPNDQNRNENYGMFYYKFTDGTWNDGDFDGTTVNSGGTAFICEWDS